MRILFLICTSVAVTLTAGGCATSSPAFVNVLDGPGPYRFDCTAPGGKYTLRQIGASGGHLEVTGKMKLLAVHPDSKWGSAGNIAFANDQGETKAAFRIVVWPFAQSALAYEVEDGSQPVSAFAAAPRLTAGPEVPFAVKLDHGLVSVVAEVAGAKATAATKTPHSDLTRVGLSCTGARVRFTDIVVTAP